MTPCATTTTTERSGQVEQQNDEGGRRRRGAFIVFEGLDRAGKSTQVERLCERLTRRGHRVKQIRFPDRTSPIGLVINSYLTQKDVQLSDEAIHLLFSANRWEKAQEIEEELKRGTTVVCDRYSFSGIAFSVIKGLSWEWCESPDRGLPSPDLTLFLSLSSETARRRAGFGGERYETQEIQDEVRRVFELIGRRLSSSSSSSSSLEERGTLWREVSAEGTIDQVEENVWEQVDDVLNGKESDRLERGIGKLWV